MHISFFKKKISSEKMVRLLISTKHEPTFKCLIRATILMNLFKVQWQFDPFECIKMVIDKYKIHILFCLSPKRSEYHLLAKFGCS